VTIDWRSDKIQPAPGWVHWPADQFSATPNGRAMMFRVRGAGRGMRWLLTLPQPIDLSKTGQLSLRYRAAGQIAAAGYVVWLGASASGKGRESIAPLMDGDLRADGAWHNVTWRATKTFVATQLAVGVDCTGEEASITLDALRFNSRAPRWSLAQVLDYQARSSAWPVGKDGFTAAPLDVSGGRPTAFLMQRLELADWFPTDQVTVGGVPFVVPRDPTLLRQTSLASFGTLSVRLSAKVREVYLLTAAASPPSEPWGIDWSRPKPQEILDVPEKVFYEIRYTDGSSDRVLPLDVASGCWGVKRGLSVSVVHPDPAAHGTGSARPDADREFRHPGDNDARRGPAGCRAYVGTT
jgi:hypothetical protein